MINILFLIIGFGVGIFVGRGIWRKAANLGAANEAMRARREEAKKRVMGLFAERTEITNDDVQKLLGVSDASATRYLQELESQGKLIQHGSEGQSVSYSRPPNASSGTI